MRAVLLTLAAALVPALLVGSAAAAPNPDDIRSDEQTLAKVKLATDGPSLLDYFSKRTYPDTNPERVAELVSLMGNDDFRTREKAYSDILALGPSALFGLRKSEGASDAEVRRRVLELRHHIEEKADPTVQAATARLIGARKPAGAALVLLAYLPFAADETVVNDICKALGEVAVHDGKPEPVVIAALKDKHAGKRGAAAEALMRARVKEQLPAVRELLNDPEPRVRLRAALSLVGMREKEAVPALIDTMSELPPETLWPAEEILVRLAGEHTPAISLGTDPESRKNAREAWLNWWLKNKDTVDLANLDKVQALLGYTLVVQQAQRIINGRFVRVAGEVMELDANKKTRWKFEVDNTFPVDAQVLPGDKVLIAEYNGRRISERDFKGNILWQQNINGNPLSARRQANGNTFVVTQGRLLEMNRSGQEVWAMQRPLNDIIRGVKLRNGDVVFITNNGQLSRIESRNQKVLKTFFVGAVNNIWGNIDVLPNGNVLVPQFGTNRVVEFDGNGREVWQVATQWPVSVMRLANGNTLVAGQNTRRIAEFDRTGREVWAHTVDGQTVFQVRRR